MRAENKAELERLRVVKSLMK